MKRIASAGAALLLALVAHAQHEGGPSFDVVGIKLGMTVKDAMLALKANNPRLMLTPFTNRLEGFPDALLFAVGGLEPVTPGPNSTAARSGEKIQILFTMPPSTEVVWGVQRVYDFATKEKPSLENTLEALRKKYGPETVPPSPDPRDATKNMAWVYDAQGKPLGARGAQLNMACAGLASAHFSGGDTSTLNEIQTGRSEPADCQSIIIVTASVLSSRIDPNSPQFEVNSLIVQIADGPRHRAATDATRAVALRATKAREIKEADEVKKRGAPKL
jgi:hypothetical protein